MSMRRGYPPGLIARSTSDDQADVDDSGPLYSRTSQQELDHTARMNAWFVESFNNSFMPNLMPIVDVMVKAENAALNELILRMNGELSHLHGTIAVLSQVIKRTITADEYQKFMQQVNDELDIKVECDAVYFGDEDDFKTLEAENDEDRPSIFKIVVKTRTDDQTDKPDALVTRKSWLQRLTGR